MGRDLISLVPGPEVLAQDSGIAYAGGIDADRSAVFSKY